MPYKSVGSFAVALLLVLTPFTHSRTNGEDLTCLKSEIGGSETNVTWYDSLKKEAIASLEKRRERLNQLKTPEQIQAYQTELRQLMIKQLGGFPERTPLNAQVLGRIPAKGYQIEKVIFESQPNHHITANLYLPEGAGRFPGVIVSSGHSRTAKTADYNQRFGIILAQHGIAALCYDPIGQGERSQMLNENGKPRYDGTTSEHSMIGTGSILVGKNTATYRIWDAMRAIDYLQSRTDIDPNRIGMTGCSGGGTLTSYVMAIDDRVVCAAPACYLTTFTRLLETLGPQDAEQNIFNQIGSGIDHADYVIMRAPKPTLISSTTSDFFDISGSWDTFRQSKLIYTRLGLPEHVDLVEAEGTHGVQPQNLAAIAQWMQRWLIGKDAPVKVVAFSEFDIRTESELLCTEHGQVLKLQNERSVFDLNAERERELAKHRKLKWESLSRDDSLALIRKTIGMDAITTQQPESNRAGKVQRDGYHIDKLVIHPSSGVPLPALTFHPVDPAESVYLYVHDQGKEGGAAANGPIEKLVKEGFVVLSLDLRGQGETASGKPDNLLGDWRTYFTAYLQGKSVVGAHAEDILSAARWAAHYKTEQDRDIHLVANGQCGVAALHAAALDAELFKSVTLHDSPEEWSSMAGSVEMATQLTTTVHAALESYDLPNLLPLIGEDKVRYVDAPSKP